MKLIKSSLAALALGLSAAGAFGQVFTGTFNFSGGGNDVSTFAYNGDPISNLTVSNIDKVGITTSSSTGNYRATAWPIGATNASDSFTGSIDLGKYIEFTLTAAGGYTIDMTSISFGVGRSGTGPRQWQWRSSLDSYLTRLDDYTSLNANLVNTGGTLTNPDTNTNFTGNVLLFSSAAFDEISTITLRLYGFNSESAAGTGGLAGNLSFAGELSVIPEPSTYAALVGFLALGVAGLRRRQRA